jgi:acetyltransferase-like isoleucine patch superfamily enzyme
MNVCIVPGATIGDGAIIGMGAVVSGYIPPLCIVGNQKLRILGYRDNEKYDRLDKNWKYVGPDGIPFHVKN